MKDLQKKTLPRECFHQSDAQQHKGDVSVQRSERGHNSLVVGGVAGMVYYPAVALFVAWGVDLLILMASCVVGGKIFIRQHISAVWHPNTVAAPSYSLANGEYHAHEGEDPFKLVICLAFINGKQKPEQKQTKKGKSWPLSHQDVQNASLGAWKRLSRMNLASRSLLHRACGGSTADVTISDNGKRSEGGKQVCPQRVFESPPVEQGVNGHTDKLANCCCRPVFSAGFGEQW